MDAGGRLTYVRLQAPARQSAAATLASPAFRAQWPDLDFRAQRPWTDPLGQTHTRLQVLHDGHRIEFAGLILHEKGGKVLSFNGALPCATQLSGRKQISLQDARELALTHVAARRYKWQSPADEAALQAQTGRVSASYFPTGELVYVPIGADFEQGAYRIAYRFDIYALEPLSRDWVYVDAETGGVLARHNRLHSYDVQGLALTGYNGNVPIIADRFATNSYRLHESGRGGGIQTLNCNQQQNFQNVTDFIDGNNVWSSFNPASDRYALDCHFGMEMTYDYFSQVHGWNSIDNQGLPLFGYMHYGSNYGNAHWDGGQMLIGDGDGIHTSSPLSPLEVVAHELSHGLTQFSANLAYMGQAGALNESISDIFGTVVEARVHPGSWSWRIGTACTVGQVGIRDMRDPNMFQHPSMVGGMYYHSANDVHINSAIPNKWFQLLVEGDTAVNELGQAYTVTGIGMDKAADIVFRLLTVYLTPSSNFNLARQGSVDAAEDLFGHCSTERVAVENAWYAVGVGGAASLLPHADFAASHLRSCELPATFSFFNRSLGADSLWWDFGDGQGSALENPPHAYQQAGTYDLSLIVVGCDGTQDTLLRPQYVTVDSSGPCDHVMQVIGMDTLRDCGSRILDPGGHGNYPVPSNTHLVLSAPPGHRISLHFNGFDTWQGDNLRIFDGPSSSYPLLAAMQGDGLPYSSNTPTIQSSGSYLMLSFYAVSVGQPSALGYDIDWHCISPLSPPTAQIVVSPEDTCYGIFTFSNNSNFGVSTFLWDFGDGVTSTLPSPTHQYTAPGAYTVTLTVCNSYGCDTLVSPQLIQTALLGSFCPDKMPLSGSAVLDHCHGVLLDPGGLGNYQNLRNTTTVLEPGQADSIWLDFSAFDLESGHDYLEVSQWNGTWLLVGSYTGTALPNGGHLSIPGEKVKLNFRSDLAGVAPGFQVEWTAFGAASGPAALPVIPVTAAVGMPVTFSQSSQGAVDWQWDFGDGSGSALYAPTHTYPSAGVYPVRLTVRDADHCYDVAAQNLYVGLVGSKDPVAPMLHIWPNPNDGRLQWQLTGHTTEPLQVEVCNSLGQVIYALESVAVSGLAQSLELRPLPAGLYFLRVSTENWTQVQKFVVEGR